MTIKSLLKPKWVLLFVFLLCAAIPIAVLAGSNAHPSDVAGLEGKTGFTQIWLSWQLSSGAEGYEVAVYEGASGEPVGAPVFKALTSGQELSIPEMTCDEAYRVTVRAWQGEKKERVWQRGQAASLSLRTRKPQVPAPVVSATAAGTDRIDLKWDATSPKEGSFTWILHTGEGDLAIRRPRSFADLTMTFQMKGLEADTVYDWQLETIYQLGEKNYRSRTEIEARTGAPPKPSAGKPAGQGTVQGPGKASGGPAGTKKGGGTTDVPDELDGVPILIDGDTIVYYD